MTTKHGDRVVPIWFHWNGKARLIVMISLILLLMLPPVLYAQAMAPEELVMAMIEAESSGDVEAQVALFADDAVYSVLPPPPDMPEPIVGTDAIRARRAGIGSLNAESITEITGVDGNTVTTLSRFSDDELRGMGLDFIDGTEEFVIEDGKIIAYTWTMTEELLAELMAAMSPSTLPESGGVNFPIYALVMALGSLMLLSGLGLALRRRYSFRQR